MISVLLIAPYTPDLPGAAEEVYSIERTPGLAVRRLPPDVRRRDIIQALQAGGFAVLWIAAHGSEAGIELGNGDRLALEDLVPYVRSAGITGVVLNSCSSAEIAEDLHDATGADVVCTVLDVADTVAYQTAALFAGHLARTGDFRAAYDLSKPGGKTDIYRYIPEYRKALNMPAGQFSSDELKAIYEAINALTSRMVTVEVELRYLRNDWEVFRKERMERRDVQTPLQWAVVATGAVVSLGLFALLWLAATGRIP